MGKLVVLCIFRVTSKMITMIFLNKKKNCDNPNSIHTLFDECKFLFSVVHLMHFLVLPLKPCWAQQVCHCSRNRKRNAAGNGSAPLQRRACRVFFNPSIEVFSFVSTRDVQIVERDCISFLGYVCFFLK